MIAASTAILALLATISVIPPLSIALRWLFSDPLWGSVLVSLVVIGLIIAAMAWFDGANAAGDASAAKPD